MVDKAIQLVRDLRLKNTLTECVASRAFRYTKQCGIMGEVMTNAGFWGLLWNVCKILCPIYGLLRLTDMQIGCIENADWRN